MSRLRIVWIAEDEQENIKRFDLSEVLYIYCALSDEFIQILFARRATREEADAFFHHLRGSYENQ